MRDRGKDRKGADVRTRIDDRPVGKSDVILIGEDHLVHQSFCEGRRSGERLAKECRRRDFFGEIIPVRREEIEIKYPFYEQKEAILFKRSYRPLTNARRFFSGIGSFRAM